MARQCIVKDCNVGCTRFQLPSQEEQRLVWLERSGNLSLDVTRRKYWKICPRHFHQDCFLKVENGEGMVLKKSSLPSLFLPDYNPKEDSNFLYSTKAPSQVTTPEKLEDMMGRSITYSPVGKVQTPTKTYKRKLIDAIPSTSKGFEEEELEGIKPLSDSDTAIMEVLPTSRNNKGISRRKVQSFFKEAGAATKKDFYKTVTLIKKLRANNVEQKGTKHFITLVTEKEGLVNILGNYSKVALNFFESNLKNLWLKPKGRRFCQEDKLFALSLYKKSARAYRFLSKFFSLPSRKSLNKIINSVCFLPGLNKTIFMHLKIQVSKLEEEDRYCVLMFDEISLHPHLEYNLKTHSIDGFVDLGVGKRRLQFADHALVFMAKGIRKPWKQPLFFGFCEGTTPTVDLVHCIKTIIGELQAIDITVIATVCDQGATNQAAVNQLVGPSPTGPLTYTIGDPAQEIVHLYDPPHLLKGIRNGLLSKDLQYVMNGSKKVACWSHISRLYEIDRLQGPYKQCPKLTDEHVVPNKIRKMKVCLASQVFSNTLACAMYVRVQNVIGHDVQQSSPDYITPQAQDTVDLLLLFDKLFDSVNGQVRYPPPGKPLLGAVMIDTDHERFWLTAISTLTSMSFVSERPVRAYTPSLKNWIFTLHGFCYLREKLLPIMDYFFPRRFNQDPLENWFSQIRGNAAGNSSCSSFINSFKSLLVSNFSSSHSVGANCEEDVSTGPLDILKAFVEGQDQIQYPEVGGEILSGNVPDAFCLDFATDYVAGAVINKFVSRFPCNSCEELLRSSEELPEHLLVRQYEGHHLVHPEEVFTFVFKQVTSSILEIISSIIHKYEVKNIIFCELKKKNYTFLLCDEHKGDRQDHLLNIIINIVFFNYIKEVNRVLKGIDMRVINRDDLFQIAHNKYLKRRKRPERRSL